MHFSLQQLLRFKIAIQTIKDHFKISLILTFLFAGMAVLYAGMYPSFKDTLTDVVQGFSDAMGWIPGLEDMGSYVGFLNVEMYQIFWMLIIAMIFGFIAASMISKEIEGKTLDILMSNPVSRVQIIIEKFVGLIPMVLLVDFVTMFAVMGVTVGIGEELNFTYLFLTHVISILYFLAIISIGILISTIIDEKMKSSIIMMSLVVAMFIFDSIAEMIEEYSSLGYLSVKHYFNLYDILKSGHIDVGGITVLLVITGVSLLLSIVYFEYKDIKV